MNLSGIWAFVAPFLKPFVDQLLANLKADGPGFIADVNALATKDEPALLAVVTKYVDEISFPGFLGSFLGGQAKDIVIAYATSELAKLVSEGEALEQPAFDSLIAKLEAAAAEAGL